MSHERLGARLEDYATGALGRRDRARVEAHLSRCEPCRSWLATYRLLAHEPEPLAHLSSAQLAALAVGVTHLDDPGRRETQAHLERCGGCRRQLDLTRKALKAARRPFLPSAWVDAVATGAARPAVWAPAAALLAGIVFGGLWLDLLQPEVPTPTPDLIRGQQVLRADRQLVLGHLRVERGADLLARAADSVVFGNGFVVDSGATLTVELGSGGTPQRD